MKFIISFILIFSGNFAFPSDTGPFIRVPEREVVFEEADLILLGKVTKVEKITLRAAGNSARLRDLHEVTISVSEVFKGDSDQSISILYEYSTPQKEVDKLILAGPGPIIGEYMNPGLELKELKVNDKGIFTIEKDPKTNNLWCRGFWKDGETWDQVFSKWNYGYRLKKNPNYKEKSGKPVTKHSDGSPAR